jgi:predicted cupin superfamily sugar epimerase
VKNGFSLVGCTVAPGFDFEDFELANQSELCQLYPQHSHLIKELT